MNVVTYPTGDFSLSQTGQLSDEFFNFFTINNQNLQYWQSNDGHLMPPRTTSDLTTLSTTQYTGRYAYNTTTGSPMTNVEGTYVNVTTHTLLSSAQLFSKNFEQEKSRSHLYITEDDRLFISINGKLKELQLKEII
jgi:hypothetical protein